MIVYDILLWAPKHHPTYYPLCSENADSLCPVWPWWSLLAYLTPVEPHHLIRGDLQFISSSLV